MGFFVLLLLLMASVVFALFDTHRFIQYEGNLQRGIKIGTSPLSKETIQYLHDLRNDVIEKDTKAFIRKQGQSVLIQPVPRYTKRYLGLWYIGLVDLSLKRPQIEFRTPVSNFFVGFFLLSLFIYQIFYGNGENIVATICTFIFTPFFFAMTHPFSKNVVVEYIDEVMQQKRG